MRCIRPLIANYDKKGNLTLNRNITTMPGLLGMTLECRKCLPCRLNTAREKAIRAVHEADTSYHESIFLTLTYAPEKLTSLDLDELYPDFQSFLKRTREHRNRKAQMSKIKYMVTGEYGDKTHRPHWHALIFNYWPKDSEHFRTSPTGHKIYRSDEIEKNWKKGLIEFGSVTMESAGYVARYGAKKLVHGKDQDHDLHPKHVCSQGLGRKWIETNYEQTFNQGFVLLPNGERAKIPRYYQEWFKVEHPEKYNHYVTTKKLEIMEQAEKKQRKEELEYLSQLFNQEQKPGFEFQNHPKTRKQVKHNILKRKFKRLQEKIKL